MHINYLLFRQFVFGKTPPSPTVSMRMIYHLARKHDEWPGEDYEGSSCRGAMKGWFHHGEAARARAADNRWKLHESRPWLLDDLEAQARLMGPGFEPYGLGEKNRRMVARFCEEQHAQGLIPRPLDPDTVFGEFEALAG